MRGPYRIKTRDPQNEVHLPQMSNQWRATMQKTALTIFGALFISGIAVQMAAASEHHRSKAYFGRDYDRSILHRAYNQVNGPINGPVNRPIYVNPRVFDNPFANRWDPSWIGDQDPSLNPAD
jgi:hypothetical protein